MQAHSPIAQTVRADGPGGSNAKCANVSAGGAIAFQGAAGDFKDMLSLAFSIRKPGGGMPDVDVNIGGNQVAVCWPVMLLLLSNGWQAISSGRQAMASSE